MKRRWTVEVRRLPIACSLEHGSADRPCVSTEGIGPERSRHRALGVSELEGKLSKLAEVGTLITSVLTWGTSR